MPSDTNRGTSGALPYDEIKELAGSENPSVRRDVAARSDVSAEILYFLAGDEDAEVRDAVARNPAAPPQADLQLVNDNNEDVRCSLAEKIARLAPGLTASEQDRIRRRTFDALSTMVRDEATRVRNILADVLKDMADAPHEIVATLARDFELVVAGPVLEHSPILTDEDLIEIIANDPVAGALNAIAVRSSVSSAVSASIVASEDRQAIAQLLTNQNAQIQEDTLDQILDLAPNNPTWHEPLVRRPVLPERAAARIASFVAENLLQVLHNRNDLPTGVLAAVDFEFRRRAHSTDKPSKASGDEEDNMLTALVSGDQDFVLSVLARRAGTTAQTVGKLIAGAEAKGLVALAWKADYSMVIAERLQRDLARIGDDKLITADANGAYPLSEDDMRWELYFHGVA